jgi:hypothetical protein
LAIQHNGHGLTRLAKELKPAREQLVRRICKEDSAAPTVAKRYLLWRIASGKPLDLANGVIRTVDNVQNMAITPDT